MIKKTGKGFQLFGKKTGKPLGPARGSKEDVMEKDEARVMYFKHMKGRKKKG